jgi:hypothetical protein
MAWRTFSATDFVLISDDYSGSVTRELGFSSGGVLQSRDIEVETRTRIYEVEGCTKSSAEAATSFSSMTGTSYVETTAITQRRALGGGGHTVTKTITRVTTTIGSWS